MSYSIALPRLKLNLRALETLKVLENKGHNPELHGLRVLAVFGIMWTHVFGKVMPKSSVESFAVCLDLLFVMSGYLIGTILILSRERKDQNFLIRFYVRRALRLFPVYYVVLFFMALYFKGVPHLLTAPFWRELLFLTNYGDHSTSYLMNWSWSLSIDEHFYLIMPLIVLAVSRLGQKGQFNAYLLMMLAGYAISVGTLFFGMPSWDKKSFQICLFNPTHTRFYFLLGGVLAAHLAYYHKETVRRRFLNGRLRTLVGLSPVCLVVAWYFASVHLTQTTYLATVVLLLWPMSCLTWIGYHLLLLHAKSLPGRVLSARIFTYLAPLTFPFFLVHPVVINRVTLPLRGSVEFASLQSGNLISWMNYTWLTVVYSLCIAYVLHIVVEKSVLSFRDRLSFAN